MLHKQINTLKKELSNEVSSNLIDEIYKEAKISGAKGGKIIGAGGGEGAMDAANLLKPALARGELHAIGATTLKEYQKYIEMSIEEYCSISNTINNELHLTSKTFQINR